MRCPLAIVVLAAFAAADEPPDPWIEAHRLLAAGDVEGADRIARAATGRDAEALVAYVARRGTEVGAIETDTGAGLRLGNDGRHADAERAWRRAAEAAETLGWLRRAGWACDRAGLAAYRRHDLAAATELWDRRVRLERARDRGLLAEALANAALARLAKGDFRAARPLLEEANERAPGDARILHLLAHTYERLGLAAKAKEYAARAAEKQTPDLLREAIDLNERIGRTRKAADLLLELAEKGERLWAYRRLMELHRRAGEPRRAIEYGEKARALETDDRRATAVLLDNLGNVYALVGEADTARARYESALALWAEVGDEAGRGGTLGNLADCLLALGRRAEAARRGAEAVEALRAAGWRAGVVTFLTNLAKVHWLDGDAASCGARAREAIDESTPLFAGLGDEEGALARGQWSLAFTFGVRAATKLADPVRFSWFVESGRAGSLLESLENRDRLLAETVPESLRKREREARAALRAARGRAARAAARVKLQDVFARVQRDAKAAADIFYPKPRPLDRIRAHLGEGEALVAYALAGPAAALVATADGARVVPLGDAEEIRALLARLRLADRAVDPAADLARLEARVATPLGLEARRVLVSPDGALHALPFALVFGGREVGYVPSGTTYALLKETAPSPGRRVLALGDPDYGSTPAPRAGLDLLRSEDLVALPGTRVEAKAVGDELLLGERATKVALFHLLKEHERWRAVHLACHGLLNERRPSFSALALTDGRLTTLDLYGLRVPADLVTLSACQTARGKVVTGEGLVGWTRAFLFAGASRVLVSLWRVDDEATRALMIRFYARWKAGADAATALKAAQDHVRAQEKWRHPFFWAAWTLWGLP